MNVWLCCSFLIPAGADPAVLSLCIPGKNCQTHLHPTVASLLVVTTYTGSSRSQGALPSFSYFSTQTQIRTSAPGSPTTSLAPAMLWPIQGFCVSVSCSLKWGWRLLCYSSWQWEQLSFLSVSDKEEVGWKPQDPQICSLSLFSVRNLSVETYWVGLFWTTIYPSTGKEEQSCNS